MIAALEEQFARPLHQVFALKGFILLLVGHGEVSPASGLLTQSDELRHKPGIAVHPTAGDQRQHIGA